jgi:MFS family permease
MKLPEFLKGNALVMTVCECIWRSTVDIVVPFVSLYVLELGGNYQTIGFIMSGASLASMLLYPLGGYIADYQGRIKLIGYMTFMYAFAFLVTGLGESWQWLALGMFLQNLTTFYWPAIQALMADSIPPGQRGLGFATIEAIPAAFGLIAPLTGAWLIGLLGMRTAMRGLYFSAFLIASALALFRLRFLKETLTNPKRLDVSPRGIMRLFADSYRGVFTTLSGITRELWVLSLLVTALVFSASFASSFWIIRATKIIGLSLPEWATVIMVSGVVGVILGIPAGRLIDRLSKRWVTGVCIILGAVLSFLFLRASSFSEVLILALAAAVVDAFLNPSLKSLFADLTPRSVRGRAMALVGGGGLNLMRNVFANSILTKTFLTLGAFLSGYIYGLDTTLPWLILSGAMLIIGGCFILFVRDPVEPEV